MTGAELRGERRSQAGHALVWAMVFAGLFAVAISSIIIPKPAYRVWALVVFGVGLTAGLAGLAYEAKRDPYDACVAMIPMAMIVMFITGTAAMLSEAARPVTGPIAAIALVAIPACTVYVLFVRFSKDPLPNLLLEDHAKDDIRELDGVQFVARQSAEVIPVGGEIEIRVFAQNGWDSERTLTFELVPLGWKKSAGILFDPAPSLTLPAGAAGMLSIPVRAGLGAPMSATLLAKPHVAGRGGKHVRRWQAQAISTHVPDWFTILAGMAGWLVTGGGLKFMVVAAGLPETRPDYPSAPAAKGTVSWKPEPGMLGGDALAGARLHLPPLGRSARGSRPWLTARCEEDLRATLRDAALARPDGSDFFDVLRYLPEAADKVDDWIDESRNAPAT